MHCLVTNIALSQHQLVTSTVLVLHFTFLISAELHGYTLAGCLLSTGTRSLQDRLHFQPYPWLTKRLFVGFTYNLLIKKIFNCACTLSHMACTDFVLFQARSQDVWQGGSPFLPPPSPLATGLNSRGGIKNVRLG